MKTLVTGGAGFIGSHLVEHLIVAGHDVVVMDDLSSGHLHNVPKGIAFVEGDIRDKELLQSVMTRERVELVVHLAAQMNVRKSIADPTVDASINILGTLNVLEAASRGHARRVVFASSGGAIYGDQSRYPCRECDTPAPSTPYGIAKLAAEFFGQYFASTTGLEFCALRLANVYGPRQDPRGEAGIVSIFQECLTHKRSPTVFGDGRQTRDFIWVGDVVRAFAAAMTGPPGTYNIGSGRETSVLELFEEMKRVLGVTGSVSFAPGIQGEVSRNVLSPDLAGCSLKWQPATPLLEGLRATLEGGSGLERDRVAPDRPQGFENSRSTGWKG